MGTHVRVCLNSFCNLYLSTMQTAHRFNRAERRTITVQIFHKKKAQLPAKLSKHLKTKCLFKNQVRIHIAQFAWLNNCSMNHFNVWPTYFTRVHSTLFITTDFLQSIITPRFVQWDWVRVRQSQHIRAVGATQPTAAKFAPQRGQWIYCSTGYAYIWVLCPHRGQHNIFKLKKPWLMLNNINTWLYIHQL